MPLYSYTARTNSGQVKTGESSAPNEHALALILREQGLLLTQSTVKAGPGAKKKGALTKEIGGVPMIQRILFTQHLAIMLDAGLSLGKALDVLSKQAGKKYFAQVILEIKKAVEQGNSFHSALKPYPKIFQPVYISMVKLGETSGNLSQVLRELSTQMQKTFELTRKIKGAMYYPAVILIAMLGVGIMLIFYVLPKLVEVFEEMGTELPLMTQWLISFSKFTTTFWPYILAVLVALIIAILFAFRSPGGEKAMSSIGLHTPKIGWIIKKINLARFCRTFSSLLKSGIPLVNALNIVADTMGNTRYKLAVQASSEEVKKGTAISMAFVNYPRIFPPLVTQIMMVGEETGTMDEVLTQLADFYEAEVSQELDNISSIIEPILMLVLGGGVALLAVSIIGPIYSMSSQIQ